MPETPISEHETGGMFVTSEGYVPPKSPPPPLEPGSLKTPNHGVIFLTGPVPGDLSSTSSALTIQATVPGPGRMRR